MGLHKEELVKWKEMSLKMNLNVNKEKRIFSNSRVILDLKNLIGMCTARNTGDIYTLLNRILKAEGKSH